MDENNDPRSLNSFEYGWELVKSLYNPQMERRKSIINLPKSSVAKINIILGNPVLAPVVIVPDELYSYKAEKRRRCTPCLQSFHGRGYSALHDKLKESRY